MSQAPTPTPAPSPTPSPASELSAIEQALALVESTAVTAFTLVVHTAKVFVAAGYKVVRNAVQEIVSHL
jgi:hypothetical protein